MPIADRKLSPGTRLVGRYKDVTHTVEVVQTDQGLRYRLENGQEFQSPSSAASAVMGGKAVNGWPFRLGLHTGIGIPRVPWPSSSVGR